MNVSKLYTGNLKPSIREIDPVELFGLNTTKYLKKRANSICQ